MKYNQQLILMFGAFIALSSFLTKQNDPLKESMERGSNLYAAHCQSCHMAEGAGIPSVFPPLAKSDYLEKNVEASILIVLNGGSEPMTVNGVEYNGMMTALDLTDQEVADVMNYIKNSWGNKAPMVKPQDVRNLR